MENTYLDEILEVGDTIEIVSIVEEPKYNGIQGVIEHIVTDPRGDIVLYGTWGDCTVFPRIDKIRKIN